MELLTERRNQREDRILETARRLIAERGYDGVVMRELASESRVSVPTLYNLFGDKSALLSRAVESQFRELLATIDRKSAGSGIDLLLAIPAGCSRALLRAPDYSKAVLGVFAKSAERSGVISVVAQTTAAQFEIALSRMLDEAALAGWVDPSALAQRLASQQIMVCLEWASGHLSDRELRPAMLYGPSMMVMGVVRGRARDVLEAQAKLSQESAKMSHRGATKKRSDPIKARQPQ